MLSEESARPERQDSWNEVICRGKGQRVTMDLLNISTSAGEAFSGFDWNEHAGKGVRLFVQGFG